MRAAVAEQGALQWVDRPEPIPGPGEVRIRVAATAVNRADLVQVAGRYPPPRGASDVLGLECSGVIDAVGPGVAESRVGERVAALLTGGGYGASVVCPASHTLAVPEAFDLVMAAALPEVWTTAYLNLVHEAGMQAGDRVLLHAGASGVGTAGIQLCAHWGATSWVTVGSTEKVARCVALGAEGGSNRHEVSWVDEVRTWAGRAGVDIVLDPVGGAYLADNQRVLANRGRLVLIGLLGGRSAELDLGRLLVKRQRVMGSVLRSRSVQEKNVILAGLRTSVWPLLMDGTLKPVVERVMPLAEASAAHRLLADNGIVGKLVLTA